MNDKSTKYLLSHFLHFLTYPVDNIEKHEERNVKAKRDQVNNVNMWHTVEDLDHFSFC